MLVGGLPYTSVVGSLMYISMGNRPDITYLVGGLSENMESPSIEHWNLAMHIIRYLNGTKSLGIHYRGGDCHISGVQSWCFPEFFVHSNWAGDPDTIRSTTGYLFKINEGTVSWGSKLQATVPLSLTEAE